MKFEFLDQRTRAAARSFFSAVVSLAHDGQEWDPVFLSRAPRVLESYAACRQPGHRRLHSSPPTSSPDSIRALSSISEDPSIDRVRVRQQGEPCLRPIAADLLLLASGLSPSLEEEGSLVWRDRQFPPEVRAAAVRQSWQQYPRVRDKVPFICEWSHLLADPDQAVRNEAQRALGELSSRLRTTETPRTRARVLNGLLLSARVNANSYAREEEPRATADPSALRLCERDLRALNQQLRTHWSSTTAAERESSSAEERAVAQLLSLKDERIPVSYSNVKELVEFLESPSERIAEAAAEVIRVRLLEGVAEGPRRLTLQSLEDIWLDGKSAKSDVLNRLFVTKDSVARGRALALSLYCRGAPGEESARVRDVCRLVTGRDKYLRKAAQDGLKHFGVRGLLELRDMFAENAEPKTVEAACETLCKFPRGKLPDPSSDAELPYPRAIGMRLYSDLIRDITSRLAFHLEKVEERDVEVSLLRGLCHLAPYALEPLYTAYDTSAQIGLLEGYDYMPPPKSGPRTALEVLEARIDRLEVDVEPTLPFQSDLPSGWVPDQAMRKRFRVQMLAMSTDSRALCRVGEIARSDPTELVADFAALWLTFVVGDVTRGNQRQQALELLCYPRPKAEFVPPTLVCGKLSKALGGLAEDSPQRSQLICHALPGLRMALVESINRNGLDVLEGPFVQDTLRFLETCLRDKSSAVQAAARTELKELCDRIKEEQRQRLLEGLLSGEHIELGRQVLGWVAYFAPKQISSLQPRIDYELDDAGIDFRVERGLARVAAQNGRLSPDYVKRRWREFQDSDGFESARALLLLTEVPSAEHHMKSMLNSQAAEPRQVLMCAQSLSRLAVGLVQMGRNSRASQIRATLAKRLAREQIALEQGDTDDSRLELSLQRALRRIDVLLPQPPQEKKKKK